MIWTSDPKGNVSYVGPEWTQFTGQASAEALGSGWLTVLHPEDQFSTKEFFLEACFSNSSFTLRYRLKRVDGSYAQVVSGAAPSFSPVDGSFLGFLGSVIEVAEAVRDLAGRRDIGKLVLPPPANTTVPLTLLDVIADHVLLAKSIAERAGEKELHACLDLAVTLIQVRLGGSRSSH